MSVHKGEERKRAWGRFGQLGQEENILVSDSLVVLFVIVVLTLLCVFRILFRLLRVRRLITLVEFVLGLRNECKIIKECASKAPARVS